MYGIDGLPFVTHGKDRLKMALYRKDLLNLGALMP